MDATEAVAEAWASIDGKLTRFCLCRQNEALERVDGFYGGYMAEAEELIKRIAMRGFSVIATPATDGRSWRCFHCDEVFTDRDAAADHFGVMLDGVADEVACKINATDGLLVKMLREAQQELSRYHQEDNAAFREFYALGANHAAALRREEERGYERGLRDARDAT